MASLLNLPEVAAAAAEATVLEWSIVEGQTFAASDVIALIETEKAVAEIEAEQDGVLTKVLVPAGEQAEVGAPLAVLGDPGEDVDLAQILPLADATGAGAGEAVDGADDQVVEPSADDHRGRPESPPARVFSSPLARRQAREAGLSVDDISGTGPRGRVMRRDVEAAIRERDAQVSSIAVSTNGGAVDETSAKPGDAGDEAAAYVEEPHTRMRRAVAARLTESKQRAPHFYLRATCRMEALLTLREQVNDGRAQRVSVNDLVVKAAAAALVEVPAMNVTWGDDVVRRYRHADIGVAVATERGLVTPVVRGVEALPVSGITSWMGDVRARAEQGRLRQADLDGGSMCVTNLGMFGIEEFTAIINPPHAAILAVGAVRDAAVVDDGQVVSASVMTVTLSVDHRPIDGVVAAKWLQAFVDLMEHPVRLLA